MLGLGPLAIGQQPRHGALSAAGEQQQPSRVRGKGVESKLGLQTRLSVQKRLRGQALQIGEPLGVLRQQHHRLRWQSRIFGSGEGDLAADDRLDAAESAGLAELQRPEQVSGIGDRHRRHRRLPRQGGDLVRLDGALAQRIGRVDSEMDEISMRHG